MLALHINSLLAFFSAFAVFCAVLLSVRYLIDIARNS